MEKESQFNVWELLEELKKPQKEFETSMDKKQFLEKVAELKIKDYDFIFSLLRSLIDVAEHSSLMVVDSGVTIGKSNFIRKRDVLHQINLLVDIKNYKKIIGGSYEKIIDKELQRLERNRKSYEDDLNAKPRN